ncbi:uncharacterized protein LOC121876705 isoform X2 [Homarus americanus]|uniref:uncharacterized protein LOC121876705 isoform X2 n=1 Tax=Homarus americanus TaxID=6706 RepID=UPI001C48635C|nr:uncharacterized protein LOC121876705 isoform X2 [Homarus americanus]
MLAEVAVGEGLEETKEESGGVCQLLCNCAKSINFSMADTLLTVLCEKNVNCTALDNQPGATIISPILLSLTGVAGQIWALYYLYTTTRPTHSRTVFFVLLSTLIWTDLVGKIITTGPALAAYVKGEWVGGLSMCNFHAFAMMLTSLVTHLLVSTMAVERFIGIRHGYFYNKNITTSRTKLLLLGIWLFSVLFCAMPLFGAGQYAMQYPGSWCFVNIHVNSTSPITYRIYTNVFGIFTIANLLVMVVCNIIVITTLLCLRLCRHRCSGTSFCAPHRTYRQRELEMQMVIVLLVITIVLLISWTPLDIRLFLNQLWPHSTRAEHMQDLIAVRLTSINQIVDPWAYIICRKLFATRAWKWMRFSLMGSRLLGRESSCQNPGGGSHKKLSKTIKPPEKIQYKTPYKGAGEGDPGLKEGVAVEAEGDGRGGGDALPPPSPTKDTATTNGDLKPKIPAAVAKEVLEAKEGDIEAKIQCLEIFKDSPTSTGCSDNVNYGTPLHSEPGVEALAVVPIPVFTCEQYRVHHLLGDHLHPSRLKRISSSASARAASRSRKPKHTLDPNDINSDSWVSALSVLGRRHSWSCLQDAPEAKQYRTQSTQTFKPQTNPHQHGLCHEGDDDFASCHQHDGDNLSHHQQPPRTPSPHHTHHHHYVPYYQELVHASYHQHVDDSCHLVNDDAVSCHQPDDHHTPYNQNDHHSHHDKDGFTHPGQPLFNDQRNLSYDNVSLYHNHKDLLNNEAALCNDKRRLLSDHIFPYSDQNDLSKLDNYKFSSEGHCRDLHTECHLGHSADFEGNTVFIVGNGISRWRDAAEDPGNINNGLLNTIYSRNKPK